MKTTQNLKKQLAKEDVEPYIKESVEELHKILIESKMKKDSPTKTRAKIKKLLEDEKFKKGSKIIELPKEDSLEKIVKAKNTKLLNFYQEAKTDIIKLRRYTIDSIKEYPEVKDVEKKIFQEKKRIRIIEAIFNLKKYEGKLNLLTFSDFLNPKNWLEEEREYDEKGKRVEGVIVDHHLTMEELPKLFPTKDLQISEGRVILGNKKQAFDITELIRQSAKESYRRLLKQEGRRNRQRRIER
ncbi:MAG: hypothetical protein EAX90_12015 [Candidatus Heimdallarchaeota archaeon]|nr:hypothetical protein [Candidatus Heimdallarchaeota archaeon]